MIDQSRNPDVLLKMAYEEYQEALKNPWYQHLLAIKMTCLNYRFPMIKKQIDDEEFLVHGYTWANDFWKEQFEECESAEKAFIENLIKEIQRKYHVHHIHLYEDSYYDDDSM